MTDAATDAWLSECWTTCPELPRGVRADVAEPGTDSSQAASACRRRHVHVADIVNGRTCTNTAGQPEATRLAPRRCTLTQERPVCP